MSLKTTTLRPGVLVSLKTTVTGNVKYSKSTLDAEHITENGEQRARWETERTVSDPVEFELAKVARSKARTLVSGCCAATSFGLLCPQANRASLNAAIDEARKLAIEFNMTAQCTRLDVGVLCGEFNPDDVAAVRAINGELSDLLEKMEQGVARLDVEAVRDAASRAKKLGEMLTPEASARVKTAVESARKAARKITKSGEVASREINAFAIEQIAKARTEFLDLDDVASIPMQAPVEQARAVDLFPTEQESPATAPSDDGSVVLPELEFDDASTEKSSDAA